MRPARHFPMALLALALGASLVASPANADDVQFGSVNLRWSACWGDGGAQNRDFACDSNAGTEFLVGSLATSSTVTDVIAVQYVVELASASSSLPAWWQFKNAGSCRVSSLIANTSPPAGAVNCLDWTNGSTGHLLQLYQVGTRSPNQARILATTYVTKPVWGTLIAGQEYWAFRLQIDHARTIGTGSCDGCPIPVCLVVQNVKIERNELPPTLVFGAYEELDRQYATWQGGGLPVVRYVTGCPAATPTRRTTWGAVKSLYR